MINSQDHYVAWCSLITELDEAGEHLQSLIDSLVRDGRMDDDDFAVQLGHVYAHLNRVWHSRNREEVDNEQLPPSSFPTDLEPVG